MNGPWKTQKPVRVLVVDDYHPMADALASALSGAGHDARAAYGGKEALRIAADFRPHAIISDVNMPEMNGFELAAAVAERFLDCRVLLMSIQGFYPFLQAHGRPVKILQKPVSVTELLEFLDTCRDERDAPVVEGGAERAVSLTSGSLGSAPRERNRVNHTIEIFSAGCKICEDTIAMVRGLAASEDEVLVHDTYREETAYLAARHGIRCVPAVVIDGKLAGCCAGRGCEENVLREALRS
jgi:DNA-binding NtrC family response regulator